MDSETLMPLTPEAVGDTPVPSLRPEDIPCLDHIVTEDDSPVDSLYSAYQQRLLTEPLTTSWTGPGEGRTFLAVSNVGLFYAVAKPPVVPDTMLSLDVEPPADPWPKQNRSYFTWVMGKPPDVVIEIVSNRERGEDTRKLRLYAQLGIAYYVIWDPGQHLTGDSLRAFSLSGKHYVSMPGIVMADIGLGVATWQGTFEKWTHTWLRWCDVSGVLIPTGAERAEREQQRADREQQRAEQESLGAKLATERAERLTAQMRSLGAEPQNGT